MTKLLINGHSRLMWVAMFKLFNKILVALKYIFKKMFLHVYYVIIKCIYLHFTCLVPHQQHTHCIEERFKPVLLWCKDARADVHESEQRK